MSDKTVRDAMTTENVGSLPVVERERLGGPRFVRLNYERES